MDLSNFVYSEKDAPLLFALVIFRVLSFPR